jgi:hypothetical protein
MRMFEFMPVFVGLVIYVGIGGFVVEKLADSVERISNK